MADYLQRLPLYESAQHQAHIELVGSSANKGLLFDRWFGGYDPSWKVDKLLQDKVRQTHPLDWLSGPCGEASRLDQARERQLALINALQGAAIRCDLDWHMVTGTGEAHPLENGFRWHHNLGVPYLPASSLKGMLRAWLTTWDQGSFTPQEIIALFGSDREQTQAHQIGALIFFDALPVTQPRLTLDVMTPHCGDWYQKGGDDPGKPDTVPADWQSPVPITFLAVREASFLFTLAARDEQGRTLLPRVMQALAEALATLGIGAKTALGYGVMTKRAAEDRDSGEALLADFQARKLADQANRRRILARASMSPHQLRVSELADRLKAQDTAPELVRKQHKEGLNNEVAALVNDALTEGWLPAEREAVLALVEHDSVWLQISKKEKARERKGLLARLKES